MPTASMANNRWCQTRSCQMLAATQENQRLRVTRGPRLRNPSESRAVLSTSSFWSAEPSGVVPRSLQRSGKRA
eukprot:7035858-Lingulodinium_polyedra.AAC.1